MGFKLFKEEDPQEPFERIQPEQAREMIESGEVQLIDVREPDEWAAGHVPQATHVPLQTFLAEPGRYVQPGDKAAFICAVGGRSAVASEMAAASGVSRVYNIEGGFNRWKELGYPAE